MDTKNPSIGAVLARYGMQPLVRWRQMFYLLGYNEAPPVRKDPPEKLKCVDFPNAGYLFLRNIPATTLLARRQGKRTSYVTLLEPLPKGGSAQYRLGNVAAKDDQVAAEVKDGPVTWLVTVRLGEDAKTKMNCLRK